VKARPAERPRRERSTQAELFDLAKLFLRLGTTTFGGTAAHIAMMEDQVVVRRKWLPREQLLDMIGMTNLIPGPNSTEMGQVTPGPVFTTATFIGYLLAGPKGALVATVGIFVPAFFLVAISGLALPRLRRSPVAAAVLDGVNAGSLALMAVVTYELGRSALDAPTIALAVRPTLGSARGGTHVFPHHECIRPSRRHDSRLRRLTPGTRRAAVFDRRS
jgi:chromate transport protein ChrA